MIGLRPATTSIARLTVSRGRFPWDVAPTPADRGHSAIGEDERSVRQGNWEFDLLGQLLSCRTAAWGIIVLLCVAGQVWQCEPGAYIVDSVVLVITSMINGDWSLSRSRADFWSGSSVLVRLRPLMSLGQAI